MPYIPISEERGYTALFINDSLHRRLMPPSGGLSAYCPRKGCPSLGDSDWGECFPLYTLGQKFLFVFTNKKKSIHVDTLFCWWRQGGSNS